MNTRPDTGHKDLEYYERAFRDIDVDGDGQITLDELLTVLRKQGQTWTREQLQDMVNLVDRNSNGTIEMAEFLELMSAAPVLLQQQGMIDAFRTFDPKGKGFVSVKTLHVILTRLGDNPFKDDVRDLIQFADRNGDGCIQYEDVVRRIYEDI